MADFSKNQVASNIEYDIKHKRQVTMNAPAYGDSGCSQAAQAVTAHHPLRRKAIYLPLKSDGQIRLLRLNGGRYEDPIHFELESVSLWQAPAFEALSYTWADETGDSSRCCKVFVGRWWNEFPVTRNCEAALRRLRPEVGDRVLWVDAVCVNQDDVSERSRQVDLMRDIYVAAWRVVLYVGEPTEDSHIALSLVSHANTEGPSFQDDLLDTEKASLTHMFSQPYFSRMWAIQEVILAKSISLVCGATSVPSSRIDRQLRRIAKLGYGPSWLRFAQDNHGVPEDDLLPLLVRTRLSMCSDPRDKVFGLLGLIRYASIAGLTPDYSLSVRQVYTGIASFIIFNQGRVDILRHSGRCSQDDGEERWGLPSWVPDWSRPPPDITVGQVARQLLKYMKEDLLGGDDVRCYLETSPADEDDIAVPADEDNMEVDIKSGTLHMTGTKLCDFCSGSRVRFALGHCVLVKAGDDAFARTAADIILPKPVKPDQLCLIIPSGWDCPVILEKTENPGKYRFVGDCAVVFSVDNERTTVPSPHISLAALPLLEDEIKFLKGLESILVRSIWFPSATLDTEYINHTLWGDHRTYAMIRLSQQVPYEEVMLWEMWKQQRDELQWLWSSVEGLQQLAAEIRNLAVWKDWREHEMASVGSSLNAWNIDKFLWSMLPTKAPTRGNRRKILYRTKSSDSKPELANGATDDILPALVSWAETTEDLLEALDPSDKDRLSPLRYLPGTGSRSEWGTRWKECSNAVHEWTNHHKPSETAEESPKPGWRARTFLEIMGRALLQTSSVVVDTRTITTASPEDLLNPVADVEWAWDWDKFEERMTHRQMLLSDAAMLHRHIRSYLGKFRKNALREIEMKMVTREMLKPLNLDFEDKTRVQII